MVVLQIESYEKKHYEFSHSIRELRQHQTNKVRKIWVMILDTRRIGDGFQF